MPGSITEVERSLASLGVHSAPQLALRLAAPGGARDVNAKLAALGLQPFDETVLNLFKELLEV
jgi:hypothetical protein